MKTSALRMKGRQIMALNMKTTHVPGKNKGKVMLFALSTCGWCKKTKALLEELGVEYDYANVDQLQGAEQETAVNEMGKYNPATNFPTMVLGSGKVIIGFKEDDIRKAFK
jgi:glutaredoxin-like protein NrdH